MATTAEDHGPQMFLATLVRGECHYLREIRFDHGIPTVILDHHRIHLLEYAVDTIGDEEGEVMIKGKFTFTPYSGPLEVGDTTELSNAVRGDRDAGTAARLRAFDARETARLQRVAAEAPPAEPFDAPARRAEIEERSRIEAQSRKSENDREHPSAPPPWRPLHSALRSRASA